MFVCVCVCHGSSFVFNLYLSLVCVAVLARAEFYDNLQAVADAAVSASSQEAATAETENLCP